MPSTHHAIFRELERLTCREIRSSGKLVELVLQKVNLMDRSQFADEECERLARTFLELVKDVLADRYQDLSIRAFTHICVALDYFLDPEETFPDAKPDCEPSGLADDLRFLVRTQARFKTEIDNYLAWKSKVSC